MQHHVNEYVPVPCQFPSCLSLTSFCSVSSPTIVAVGFADILPAATPSRVIVMLSGLLALLIVASAVAVMNEQLQLSRAETKVSTAAPFPAFSLVPLH